MVRQGDSIIIRKRDNQKANKVPHTAEVAVTYYFDSGYYLQFESREDIFNGMLEALRDDNISRVALYGMVGSGKTILAKQVGKRAKELSLFNLVVFVKVSWTPDVKRMQGDIADQLGVVMGEEDDLVARQRQISLRLRNEGRVLMILDDVWGRLDLQRIGILNDECGHLGCKVLSTSLSREVGYLMESEVRFHLYLLTDEEAFSLLRRHAGIHDGSPAILYLARQVADRCKGIPLLISVVGSALRGKTVAQWRKALGICLKYNHQDYSVLVRGLLEWSYNSIRSKAAQTVFLICALWPVDSEILSEDLSQHAVRLGLCSSRNEASAAINSLKDSGLLMHSHKSKDHVIMHELVRDATVEILYRENPSYKHSIKEYVDALCYEEGFQWEQELDRLLRQLYGVRENHAATLFDNGGGDQSRELQVVQPYHYTEAPTIPMPSGELVDFCGLCKIDRSFLPLLEEACARKPQLIKSQRIHTEMLRQSAFECLGRVLFLLHNVRNRNLVSYKGELEMFWEQLKAMKFDLDWLSPTVEGVLASAETARIEALREEHKYWTQEAAKLLEQYNIANDKVQVLRNEIARAESKLNNASAIALVSNVRVSKLTLIRNKFLCLK